MWVIRRISIILQPNCKGEMLEWLKRHAWKACIPLKGIPGSNPGLSAKGERCSPFFVEQSADLQQVSVFNIVKIANCSRFLEEKKRSPFSESVRAFCVHPLVLTIKFGKFSQLKKDKIILKLHN